MSVDGDGDKEEVAALTSVYRLHTGAVAKRVDDLKAWRQGHLIVPPRPLALPLTWVMPPGTDEITGLSSPEASLFSPYFNVTSTSLMVVASQTCDVSGADTGKVHPFVMAAPLTPESELDPSQVGLAKLNRSPYPVLYHP